ncbi:hypothetical protein Cgig2_012905 [Carnegiea gigantea]|uniref:Uncharacterized protein n=1 Tax=Carnegiea gigantea TaxID=171969 RepID=A0A9Q1K604_9CARY|nr:hypothetical protein Cgig2_012905 [Carnegiea gigantea]
MTLLDLGDFVYPRLVHLFCANLDTQATPNGVFLKSIVKNVKLTLDHLVLESIFGLKFINTASSNLTCKHAKGLCLSQFACPHKIAEYKRQNKTPPYHFLSNPRNASPSQCLSSLPPPSKAFDFTKPNIEGSNTPLTLHLLKPLPSKSLFQTLFLPRMLLLFLLGCKRPLPLSASSLIRFNWTWAHEQKARFLIRLTSLIHRGAQLAIPFQMTDIAHATQSVEQIIRSTSFAPNFR